MMSVMLRMSVETMRELLIMHQRVNSVLYSVSVIPGQCFMGVLSAHPSPPVIMKSASFQPPGPN